MRGALIVLAGLALSWFIGRLVNRRDRIDDGPVFDLFMGVMAIGATLLFIAGLILIAVLVEKALP